MTDITVITELRVPAVDLADHINFARVCFSNFILYKNVNDFIL